MSTCPITEVGEREMEQVSLVVSGEALATGASVRPPPDRAMHLRALEVAQFLISLENGLMGDSFRPSCRVGEWRLLLCCLLPSALRFGGLQTPPFAVSVCESLPRLP